MLKQYFSSFSAVNETQRASHSIVVFQRKVRGFHCEALDNPYTCSKKISNVSNIACIMQGARKSCWAGCHVLQNVIMCRVSYRAGCHVLQNVMMCRLS